MKNKKSDYSYCVDINTVSVEYRLHRGKSSVIQYVERSR